MSTPDKAFWEAISLVAVLLLILLASVAHLGTWRLPWPWSSSPPLQPEVRVPGRHRGEWDPRAGGDGGDGHDSPPDGGGRGDDEGTDGRDDDQEPDGEEDEGDDKDNDEDGKGDDDGKGDKDDKSDKDDGSGGGGGDDGGGLSGPPPDQGVDPDDKDKGDPGPPHTHFSNGKNHFYIFDKPAEGGTQERPNTTNATQGSDARPEAADEGRTRGVPTNPTARPVGQPIAPVDVDERPYTADVTQRFSVHPDPEKVRRPRSVPTTPTGRPAGGQPIAPVHPLSPINRDTASTPVTTPISPALPFTRTDTRPPPFAPRDARRRRFETAPSPVRPARPGVPRPRDVVYPAEPSTDAFPNAPDDSLFTPTSVDLDRFRSPLSPVSVEPTPSPVSPVGPRSTPASPVPPPPTSPPASVRDTYAPRPRDTSENPSYLRDFVFSAAPGIDAFPDAPGPGEGEALITPTTVNPDRVRAPLSPISADATSVWNMPLSPHAPRVSSHPAESNPNGGRPISEAAQVPDTPLSLYAPIVPPRGSDDGWPIDLAPVEPPRDLKPVPGEHGVTETATTNERAEVTPKDTKPAEGGGNKPEPNTRNRLGLTVDVPPENPRVRPVDTRPGSATGKERTGDPVAPVGRPRDPKTETRVVDEAELSEDDPAPETKDKDKKETKGGKGDKDEKPEVTVRIAHDKGFGQVSEKVTSKKKEKDKNKSQMESEDELISPDRKKRKEKGKVTDVKDTESVKKKKKVKSADSETEDDEVEAARAAVKKAKAKRARLEGKPDKNRSADEINELNAALEDVRAQLDKLDKGKARDKGGAKRNGNKADKGDNDAIADLEARIDELAASRGAKDGRGTAKNKAKGAPRVFDDVDDDDPVPPKGNKTRAPASKLGKGARQQVDDDAYDDAPVRATTSKPWRQAVGGQTQQDYVAPQPTGQYQQAAPQVMPQAITRSGQTARPPRGVWQEAGYQGSAADGPDGAGRSALVNGQQHPGSTAPTEHHDLVAAGDAVTGALHGVSASVQHGLGKLDKHYIDHAADTADASQTTHTEATAAAPDEPLIHPADGAHIVPAPNGGAAATDVPSKNNNGSDSDTDSETSSDGDSPFLPPERASANPATGVQRLDTVIAAGPKPTDKPEVYPGDETDIPDIDDDAQSPLVSPQIPAPPDAQTGLTETDAPAAHAGMDVAVHPGVAAADTYSVPEVLSSPISLASDKQDQSASPERARILADGRDATPGGSLALVNQEESRNGPTHTAGAQQAKALPAAATVSASIGPAKPTALTKYGAAAPDSPDSVLADSAPASPADLTPLTPAAAPLPIGSGPKTSALTDGSEGAALSRRLDVSGSAVLNTDGAQEVEVPETPGTAWTLDSQDGGAYPLSPQQTRALDAKPALKALTSGEELSLSPDATLARYGDSDAQRRPLGTRPELKALTDVPASPNSPDLAVGKYGDARALETRQGLKELKAGEDSPVSETAVGKYDHPSSTGALQMYGKSRRSYKDSLASPSSNDSRTLPALTDGTETTVYEALATPTRANLGLALDRKAPLTSAEDISGALVAASPGSHGFGAKALERKRHSSVYTIESDEYDPDEHGDLISPAQITRADSPEIDGDGGFHDNVLPPPRQAKALPAPNGRDSYAAETSRPIEAQLDKQQAVISPVSAIPTSPNARKDAFDRGQEPVSPLSDTEGLPVAPGAVSPSSADSFAHRDEPVADSHSPVQDQSSTVKDEFPGLFGSQPEQASSRSPAPKSAGFGFEKRSPPSIPSMDYQSRAGARQDTFAAVAEVDSPAIARGADEPVVPLQADSGDGSDDESADAVTRRLDAADKGPSPAAVPAARDKRDSVDSAYESGPPSARERTDAVDSATEAGSPFQSDTVEVGAGTQARQEEAPLTDDAVEPGPGQPTPREEAPSSESEEATTSEDEPDTPPPTTKTPRRPQDQGIAPDMLKNLNMRTGGGGNAQNAQAGYTAGQQRPQQPLMAHHMGRRDADEVEPGRGQEQRTGGTPEHDDERQKTAAKDKRARTEQQRRVGKQQAERAMALDEPRTTHRERISSAFRPVGAGLTVLKHAPVWSLMTTATTVGYAFGARELATIVTLGTTPAVSKRTLADEADTLAFGQSAGTLIVVLHVWIVVGLVFVLILANLTLAAAERKAAGHARASAWDWHHPFRSSGHCLSACWKVPAKGVASVRALSFRGIVGPPFRVLVMDAKPRGPWRTLRMAGRWTYVRLLVFVAQLLLAVLFVRQVVSFVYLVATGSATSFSSLQDVAATQSALASTASSTSISEAFIALNMTVLFVVIAMSVGWHALLHPRRRRKKSKAERSTGHGKDEQAGEESVEEQARWGSRVLGKVFCGKKPSKKVRYGISALVVLGVVVVCAAIVYSKQTSSSSTAGS